MGVQAGMRVQARHIRAGRDDIGRDSGVTVPAVVRGSRDRDQGSLTDYGLYETSECAVLSGPGNSMQELCRKEQPATGELFTADKPVRTFRYPHFEPCTFPRYPCLPDTDARDGEDLPRDVQGES